jgi:hypothetical protein
MSELDPELQTLLIAAKRDPRGFVRQHAINHFQYIETIVARLDGLSDDRAAKFFQMMLDDAEPGTEPIILRFIDDIKGSRSAKPS